jgi:hypothetical protein
VSVLTNAQVHNTIGHIVDLYGAMLTTYAAEAMQLREQVSRLTSENKVLREKESEAVRMLDEERKKHGSE